MCHHGNGGPVRSDSLQLKREAITSHSRLKQNNVNNASCLGKRYKGGRIYILSDNQTALKSLRTGTLQLKLPCMLMLEALIQRNTAVGIRWLKILVQ